MSDTSPHDSPAMRHYRAVKAAHPDALLLYRMGDFFECFYDDAQAAARALGITLTARHKAIPMAGIPARALDGYLKKLIDQGIKVAICDQIEDARPPVAPGEGSSPVGLIQREVTRIVTAGTLTESTVLDERRPNYLLAVRPGRAGLGLAWVELSTGEFVAAEPPAAALPDLFERLNPSEVLLPEEYREAAGDSALDGLLTPRVVTVRPGWDFDPETGARALAAHFGTRDLAGFGCADLRAALGAAGAVLAYLVQTQKAALAHVRALRAERAGETMLLDRATCRCLELVHNARDAGRAGTLLELLDRTRTPMGARLLRAWLLAPLVARAPLDQRLDAVAALGEAPEPRARLGAALASVLDLERIGARLGTGRASPRDLAGLRQSLEALPALREALSECGMRNAECGVEAATEDRTPRAVLSIATEHPEHSATEDTEITEGSEPATTRDRSAVPTGSTKGVIASPFGAIGDFGGKKIRTPHSALRNPQSPAPLLADLHARLDSLPELAALLERALVDQPPVAISEGGLIKDGYHAELDELRAIMKEGKGWIARFQAREIARTGIESLKVGFNRVFGYYVELTRAQAERAPADYQRKQTLKNAERYVTDELTGYEQKVRGAETRAHQLERELFMALRETAAGALDRLQATARAAATIDVLAAFAEGAVLGRYVRPEFTDEVLCRLEESRHPVVERAGTGEPFVPNDCLLGGEDDARLLILTGPNMAGKSTYIRQVALIQLMAQIGSFVPARRAVLGLADRVFARVGAADELARGNSTFMVEMTETANILHNATERSLLVFDEVGRGTGTFDGLALAWALCEHLLERLRARTLFATHYHELTELAALFDGVANANVAVKEWGEQVIFLHRIVPGGTDQSYGLYVARMAGLPAPLLERARALLFNLERQAVDEQGRPKIAGPAAATRAARRGGRRVPAPPAQRSLFEAPQDVVLRELRALDPDRMTPLDALQALKSLRDRLPPAGRP